MTTLTRCSVLLALSTLLSAAQDDGVQSALWTQSELEDLSRKIYSEIEELRGERFHSPVAV